ncbi:MAG: glycine cleavage system aminomethyltransferase GcvT [Bacteroidales bacterium]
MKNTVFTDLHKKLGARMQPFAGYNMPVEYSGINDEHITVRQKAGVFDVSHMGEFRVNGPDASRFLQFITSNDINRLPDGMVQYTCLPNGKGGIVDDLLVYRFGPEAFMLVVNAANIEKDWNWCVKHAGGYGLEPGKELYNASDEISLLAVQGPLALKTIQKLTDEPVEEMKFYTFKKITVAGISNVILSITGYTGAGGCEIYVANEHGPALWDAVFKAGEEYGIKPAGLGARDTLRLEMGFCLYGNDIDESTSPIEAGLGWITKFVDNNDFIDRELLFRQKKEGPSRKLVGFVLREKGIPRRDYEIAGNNGNIIGRVTSGTMSPMMKTGIGMGYVDTGYAKEGTEINILIRKKSIKADVVRPPIYKSGK